MWTVIKYQPKSLKILKDNLKKKLGEDCKIYVPQIEIKRRIGGKFSNNKVNILGDYLFCFHESFKNENSTFKIKFIKGLKYILSGCFKSQNEISKFINLCKNSENKEGNLTESFYDFSEGIKYKFKSGPFTDQIFQIINIQKNKIKVLIGDIKTTIKKREFLFQPI